MKKFWMWDRDDQGGDASRILRLEGPIDNENFWGDEVTPQQFRSELEAEDGDVTVWINSPGGNVFAAAEIYTMLRDYPHAVTVKIASIAASAASVIAMAGDRILMSPTALLMIHDPMTIAMGNKKEFEKAIDRLGAVKESLVTAYMDKTGLSHDEISDLMENETWLPAKKAVELGFADEVLYEESSPATLADPKDSIDEGAAEATDKSSERSAQIYQGRMMGQTIMNYLTKDIPEPRAEPDPVAEIEPEANIDPSDAESKSVTPLIGFDGKTEDGSMPFVLLMAQHNNLK